MTSQERNEPELSFCDLLNLSSALSGRQLNLSSALNDLLNLSSALKDLLNLSSALTAAVKPELHFKHSAFIDIFLIIYIDPTRLWGFAMHRVMYGEHPSRVSEIDFGSQKFESNPCG